jgi:hypothetical protein
MGEVRVRVELMVRRKGGRRRIAGRNEVVIQGGMLRPPPVACGYQLHPSSMDRGAVESARPVRAPCTLLHAHGDGVVRLDRRAQSRRGALISKASTAQSQRCRAKVLRIDGLLHLPPASAIDCRRFALGAGQPASAQ